MLSGPIENLILAFGAERLTDIFILILGAVFIISILFKRSNRHHAFTQYTPTLLTTLGILGTFFGIVSGLLGFDVADIDGSISALLAGMKTAFTTSLLGMLLAVVYKVAGSTGWLAPTQADAIDEDQIGIAELYTVMQEQRDGVLALQSAIGSGDESSLTGQMKLLRSDNNDNHKAGQKDFEAFQDRLWIKLQDFADMLSKSATEQVIEALKQVIVDFNTNLTEQFGENFKQLNEAVISLVEWQERYRHQLEEMIRQYSLGVEAITQTEVSVASINDKASTIPDSMDRLSEVMTVNQHQIQELGRHLDAFAEVKDKAVEAVPQIHARIEETLAGVETASARIAEGVTQAGRELAGAVAGGAEDFVEASQRVHGALQASADVISQNSEQVKEQFSDLVSELNGSFRSLFAEVEAQNTALAGQYTQEVERVMSGLRGTIQDALSDTGDAVKKQITMLDQAREREMEAIAREMGSALASISGQFTRDYQQLVEAMRTITKA